VTFVDCADRIENIKFTFHPTYDLAWIKFEGFEKTLFTDTPVFKVNHQNIHPGAMLCRLGFPVPEFNNYQLNSQKQMLEWNSTGTVKSPRFPIDRMLTRFLDDKSGKVYGM